MSLTHIEASVANLAKPRQAVRLSFLVDSGAFYSVAPTTVLRKLGIKPHSRRTFILADGSRITRRVGDVLFRFDNHQSGSPVIGGGKGRQPSSGQRLTRSPRLYARPAEARAAPSPNAVGPAPPSLPLADRGPIAQKWSCDSAGLIEFAAPT